MSEPVTIPAVTVTVPTDPALSALAAKEAADLTTEQAVIKALSAQVATLAAGLNAANAQIAKLQNAPAGGVPANLVVSSLTVNGDSHFYGRTKRYIDDRINPATGLPFRAYAEDQTISMAASAAAGHEVVIFQDLAHTLAAELDPATGKVRIDMHRTGYLFGEGEINQRKHHDPQFLEDEDGMSRYAYDAVIFDFLTDSRFRLFGQDLSFAKINGLNVVVGTPTPAPKPPVIPPGIVIP